MLYTNRHSSLPSINRIDAPFDNVVTRTSGKWWAVKGPTRQPQSHSTFMLQTENRLVGRSVCVQGANWPLNSTHQLYSCKEDLLWWSRRGEQSIVDVSECCPHVTVWVLRWQGVIPQSHRNPVRQEVNGQTQPESASPVIVIFHPFHNYNLLMNERTGDKEWTH